MDQSDIGRLRSKYGISILELAARTGLPSDYLEKLENADIEALETDLKRIEKAIQESVQ